MHSVITSGSEPYSSAFCTQLELRDGEKCVVTSVVTSLVTSDLTPKTHQHGGYTGHSEEILWRAGSGRDPQIRSEDWDPPLYPIK